MSAQMPRGILLRVGVLASGGGVLFGYDMGVVSGALTQLRDHFGLSCYEQSMVVSSMLIGAFLGSAVGGVFVDGFGRRSSVLLSCALYLAGAVLLGLSPSYGWLVAGRLTVGFGMALSAASECVYVSEVAPSDRRGALVSLNELGITVGILASYFANLAFAGNLVTGWRYMFGLAGVGAVFILAVAATLPESPRFLLARGRREEARGALERVRSDAVEREFEEIERRLAPEGAGFFGSLKQRRVYNAVLVGAALVLLQQSTGEPNVLYYASTILRGVGFESEVAASLGAVGLGVSKVFATVLCLVFVDKVGRRTFLLGGCAVMVVSIFGVALLAAGTEIRQENLCTDFNETLNATEVSMTSQIQPALKWISLALLMLFIAAYSLSFGPITWILLSEIFPANIRGRLFSYVTSLNWAANLVVSATFLSFADSTGGLTTPFILSAVFGLFALFFIYFFVPETKGKSLEDVVGQLDKPLANQVALKCGHCCVKREGTFLPLIENSSET